MTICYVYVCTSLPRAIQTLLSVAFTTDLICYKQMNEIKDAVPTLGSEGNASHWLSDMVTREWSHKGLDLWLWEILVDHVAWGINIYLASKRDGRFVIFHALSWVTARILLFEVKVNLWLPSAIWCLHVEVHHKRCRQLHMSLTTLTCTLMDWKGHESMHPDHTVISNQTVYRSGVFCNDTWITH